MGPISRVPATQPGAFGGHYPAIYRLNVAGTNYSKRCNEWTSPISIVGHWTYGPPSAGSAVQVFSKADPTVVRPITLGVATDVPIQLIRFPGVIEPDQ